ncbi:MAG: hypothetical protein, partial [Olavius algarvensis Gamma 1 endosymbiont]
MPARFCRLGKGAYRLADNRNAGLYRAVPNVSACRISHEATKGEEREDESRELDLNLASSLRHGVTTHSGRSWRGNLFTRCRCG